MLGGSEEARAEPLSARGARLAEEEAVVFSAWDKHMIDRHAPILRSGLPKIHGLLEGASVPITACISSAIRRLTRSA